MSMKDWNVLMKNVVRLNSEYATVVFIGGVAVYLHILHSGKAAISPEVSHDVDLFFGLADFTDLRDIEEVTRNNRLNKSQMFRDGIEFDIYLEHNNGLAVSYSDVMTHAKVINKIRVACLEHLLVLKLFAYEDRKNSSKGRKDERDVIKILYLMGETAFNPNLVSLHLTSSTEQILKNLPKSQQILEISGRNAHVAKALRSCLSSVVSRL